MKKRLLEFLVCPIDRTTLELIVWETKHIPVSEKDKLRIQRSGLDETLFTEEVMTGLLINRDRKIFYPVYKGVPRMTVFPTGAAERFAKQYENHIQKDFPHYHLPNQKGMPGEEDVLRTFSNEWVDYDWDGNSYWNLTPAEMFKCMEFMLDIQSKFLKDKLVLEAGIGIGGIADHISKCTECELIGVDLSYAVDAAYANFGSNRFFHIVQASIFALPFQERSFDYVYSQGVIHHTFSTKTAFDSLSKFPKEGSRLFTWVYSPYDEERNALRRILMLLENIIRPICWRLPSHAQTIILLPIIIAYIIYQNFFSCHEGPNRIKYRWRHALHAARDRFTPRYIHRHDNDEVCTWFRQAGYQNLTCSSERECPSFVPVPFVACTGVEGVKGGNQN
ncbi:MAG: methyltransferase domain-containing protein [Desulfobacteraceae bacterium]|nr:MAG: methyltransferase domain-containing protein [Desulfobacteraceae bacterium]